MGHEGGYGLIVGDLGSKLVVTCLDHETSAPINLTGKTVKLRYKIDGATLQTKTMTVQTPATAGKAEYQFGASDLSAGILTGEVRINEGLSDQLTALETFALIIRAPLS